MAIKIVQTTPRLTANSVSVASTGIALKSGYIRVGTAATAVYVDIGVNPTATTGSFLVPAQNSEVFKERVSKQVISGITTGTTTVIRFGENVDNPFATNDYITLENVYAVFAGIGSVSSGINTSHNPITNWTNSSVSINFNSSAYTGIGLTNSTVARSVKVAILAENSTASANISEVQISSQA